MLAAAAAALPTIPLIDAGTTAQQYTLQQNEILFRGMSDLKEEFLFLVLTSPVSLADITEMLTGLAENTSTWAAWQNGARGVTFGVSLPALLSGGLAQSASMGFGEGQGSSHSTGQAHTDSQAHTDGSAHTTGTADTAAAGRTRSVIRFPNPAGRRFRRVRRKRPGKRSAMALP